VLLGEIGKGSNPSARGEFEAPQAEFKEKVVCLSAQNAETANKSERLSPVMQAFDVLNIYSFSVSISSETKDTGIDHSLLLRWCAQRMSSAKADLIVH
jgi:hypothetical protein